MESKMHDLVSLYNQQVDWNEFLKDTGRIVLRVSDYTLNTWDVFVLQNKELVKVATIPGSHITRGWLGFYKSDYGLTRDNEELAKEYLVYATAKRLQQ